jgi:integrase
MTTGFDASAFTRCGTLRRHRLKLGVPPKDAQVILGHAHVTTTQQIYTHVDEAAKLDAITRLNKLLGGAE